MSQAEAEGQVPFTAEEEKLRIENKVPTSVHPTTAPTYL
jgi:hypothetical protein